MDDNLPSKGAPCWLHTSPFAKMRAGNMCNFYHPLWPDHNVGGVKMHIRERAQEGSIKSASAIVPFPSLTGWKYLIYAVRCKR